ncbi:hypothetical protein Pmani_024454 [Petrolisthes manimaculis]|uniref:Galactosylceramide sulfotransferase n=1 Tax=Petrolisthes manimaculis TaxID=1843537 RepID=A0AAE1P7G7_9EUCA|nr:hypothetical protein Pmani_024454 [Petrolisthes manimaculis]
MLLPNHPTGKENNNQATTANTNESSGKRKDKKAKEAVERDNKERGGGGDTEGRVGGGGDTEGRVGGDTEGRVGGGNTEGRVGGDTEGRVGNTEGRGGRGEDTEKRVVGEGGDTEGGRAGGDTYGGRGRRDTEGRVGVGDTEEDTEGDAEENPIIVAVPANGTYIGSPWTFTASMIQSLPWLHSAGGRVNVFAVHTRLNTREMRKVVEPGALWVTAVRHPVHLYTSIYYYFKVWAVMREGLRSSLAKPFVRQRWTRRLNGIFGINQMTFDLGYGQSTFYNDLRIANMIREVESNFDLVLVTDRMDESLVLLRHALCWSLQDVIAFRKNTRIAGEGGGKGEGGRGRGEGGGGGGGRGRREAGGGGGGGKGMGVRKRRGRDTNIRERINAKDAKRPRPEEQPVVLTEEEETKIAQLNYADLRLYQHFADKFDQLVEAYGRERLQREVDELRRERRRLEEYCIEEEVPGHDPLASVKEYSEGVVGFRLSHPEDPTCRALAWNARHFVDFFRIRQMALYRSRTKRNLEE